MKPRYSSPSIPLPKDEMSLRQRRRERRAREAEIRRQQDEADRVAQRPGGPLRSVMQRKRETSENPCN